MSDTVTLIGLDFGTTTSSAVIASASLVRHAGSGRTQLVHVTERHRSEVIFTPLVEDRLDEDAMSQHLDAWLKAGDVRPDEVFGGGALLTGLTAQRSNAAGLVRLVRARLRDALIATAGDPCLESWLAFMGSTAELSRANPERHFLNLDVGGGTTNLALGRDGAVARTGCLFVGARHIQVEPGTYRIVRLSSFAQALLDHLGIHRTAGDSLRESEVNTVLDFYESLLTAAVRGRAFESAISRLHEQVPLTLPPGVEPIVTLSGGVGELVYAHLRGEPWPPTTAFGDLGIDLACRLARLWPNDLRNFVPDGGGHATVFGLLRHATQVSGNTVFVADPSILPLNDLPILGTIAAGSGDNDIRSLLDLVQRAPLGGCVQVAVGSTRAAAVADLGKRMAALLNAGRFPETQPLVLFVRENVGKVLGNYVSGWGTRPLKLVVVDELPVPEAQYARIGRLREQVLPVSFFGLSASPLSPCTQGERD